MAINETQSRQEQVLDVAKAMMTAARTAPKGKGVDNLEIVTIVDREEIEAIVELMSEISEKEESRKFFCRDAGNLRSSDAVVIIGTRIGVFGLNCGYCGYPTCAEKLTNSTVPCAFNMNDLGIAIGSAVSIAADNRVDSRVMWSVAHAAMKLGFVGDCHAAFAIVLSCSSKSPFFDRVSTRK